MAYSDDKLSTLITFCYYNHDVKQTKKCEVWWFEKKWYIDIWYTV